MNKTIRSLLSGSALVCVGFAPALVNAQSMNQEQMLRRMEALESELQALKGQMATTQATAATAQAAAQKAAADNSGVKVSTAGGIKVETTDGNFSASLGGRLLVDQAFYDEDKTRMGDGAEVRSIRLDVTGQVYKDWIYKLQADFGVGINNGSAVLKDTYFGYQGWGPLVEILAGNYLEPISLDNMTSNKYTTFMEPALPQQTLQDRRLGVQVTARGSNWTAAGGIFSANVDTTGNDPAGEGDSGWDLSGRFTYAPIMTKTEVVHLGFGINDRNPNSEALRYRARPESHETGARLIDTGAIANVTDAITFEPEAAVVLGPFHSEAEYQWLTVHRGAGSPDLDFHGWYAVAGWFLTGEVRPYQLKDTPYSADFARVKPLHNLGDGGFGAFEVAARYSSLDLSDANVRGGGERDVTLGLNWYVNPFVRFMFNYVKVDTDNEANPAGLGNAANLIPGNANAGNDDPSIFQLRGQVDF